QLARLKSESDARRGRWIAMVTHQTLNVLLVTIVNCGGECSRKISTRGHATHVLSELDRFMQVAFSSVIVAALHFQPAQRKNGRRLVHAIGMPVKALQRLLVELSGSSELSGIFVDLSDQSLRSSGFHRVGGARIQIEGCF